MKKSEELRLISSQEDNDIKAFGLLTKALRESRSEKFVDGWLEPLSMRYDVKEDNHKYTITTQDYGVLDYFPKANKLLIRKENKWVKPGLKWIINNLMN
jgi:hypothetical protein